MALKEVERGERSTVENKFRQKYSSTSGNYGGGIKKCENWKEKTYSVFQCATMHVHVQYFSPWPTMGILITRNQLISTHNFFVFLTIADTEYIQP